MHHAATTNLLSATAEPGDWLYRVLRKHEENFDSLRDPPTLVLEALDARAFRKLVLESVAFGNKVRSPFPHVSTSLNRVSLMWQEHRAL